MGRIEDLISALRRLLGERPAAQHAPKPAAVTSADPPIAAAPPEAESAPVPTAAVAEAPAAAPTNEAAVAPPSGISEAPTLAPEIRDEPEPVRAAAAEAATDVESDEAPAAAATVEDATAPASEGGLVLRLETERAPAPIFVVTRAGATVGRSPENTIRLDDLSVSRRHARIVYRQGGYWMSDVGSMGGTWIDGARLNAPRRIETGQVIDIGVCRLTVASVSEQGAERPRRPQSAMAARASRRR